MFVFTSNLIFPKSDMFQDSFHATQVNGNTKQGSACCE